MSSKNQISIEIPEEIIKKVTNVTALNLLWDKNYYQK